MRSTIASPNPAPATPDASVRAADARVNGCFSRSTSSGATPGPRSAMSITIVARSRRVVTSTGGPPYAMYLQHRGLSKEQYRATLGLSTLTSISLRTMAFLITGTLLDAQVWLYAIAIVPAGLIGLWAANHLFRRISRDGLMRAVSLMLAASGASLIVRALG